MNLVYKSGSLFLRLCYVLFIQFLWVALHGDGRTFFCYFSYPVNTRFLIS